MHKDVVYARLYAAFFQKHPEMLTEVRYILMPDGDEHQLVLSIPAVRCLLDWGVAQAYFTECAQAMRAPPAVFRGGVNDHFL